MSPDPMPNLMQQLMAQPGCWPKSWEYEQRNGRHTVTQALPNGAVFKVADRHSERLAESAVSCHVQRALDADMGHIAPDARRIADELGMRIVRECRKFLFAGDRELEVWSRRVGLLDSTGQVVEQVTESIANVEREIYRRHGQATAVSHLLDSDRKIEEPRTTTTPRG